MGCRASRDADGHEAGGCCACVSSDAAVHLADGGTKCAREVRVGDKLQTIDGGVTSIRAVLHTAAARRMMVRIGRLLITNNHPVVNDEGQWAQPITLPEAKWELTDTDIYTFVTDHQLPFIVEGYVAASVGTACTGLFNPKKLRHCLWNSEHIVRVLRQQCHNQWPYVEFKEADPILKVLHSEAFADAYFKEHTQGTVQHEARLQKGQPHRGVPCRRRLQEQQGHLPLLTFAPA